MIITSKMLIAVKMMLTSMIVICNLYDGLRRRRRMDAGDIAKIPSEMEVAPRYRVLSPSGDLGIGLR